MRLAILAGLLLAALAAVQGCKKQAGGSATSKDILLGEFASTSGNTATFGQSSHAGLMLAVDQANSAGGVLGKQVHIITVDDASDAGQAVTAVQKLINDDGVVAVLGEVASKRSLAGAGICQRYKVPMLSPASTNPAVTVEDGKPREWIFRICFTDTFQGAANGKFANDQGYKRVAVLTNVDEDYSKGLGKNFKQAYEGHGEIVADETYRGSDRDFKAQLTKIAQAKPDAVYVPGYYTEVKLICSQAQEVGLKVPFFGGDGWDSPETLAADSTQGNFYSDHYTAEDPSPLVQDFVKAFQAKYGKTPDAMAVLGYDCGRVMIDAIRRAGKAEPAAIRDALATTKDFPGASGSITIDAEHNARKPLAQLVIQDHKAKLFKIYQPSDVEAGK